MGKIVKEGFRSQFLTPPQLTSHPENSTLPRDPILRQATLNQVEVLLEKNVIQEVSHPASPGFYSRFFIVPKKDPGKWRAILDLSQLNKYISKEKFKMETAENIRSLIKKGNWTASLDLSDAYHHIPIHKHFQKFLRFKINNKIYQYQALPMGLTDSARVFTKVIQEIKRFLQREGICLFQYLDDWLVQGKSQEVVHRHMARVLEVTQSLGFMVNVEKSDLDPRQRFTFLGYRYDLEKATITPVENRLIKLRTTLTPFLDHTQLPAKDWQVAIGMLVSLEKLVPRGLLRLRALQMNLSEFWDQSTGCVNQLIPVSEETKRAVQWWLEDRNVLAGSPLHAATPEARIFTDASTKGWGGHLEHPQLHVSGVWNTEDQSLHTNVKELLAVLYTLRGLQKWVENKTVLVTTDNTTVVAYINRQGGTRSHTMLTVTKRLFAWAETHETQIICRHIPGRLNVIADGLSRTGQVKPTEWKLEPRIVRALWLHWEKPLLDLFATRQNAQLPLFVSPVPDEQAMAVDALSIPWTNLYAYAFPPTAILAKVLQKLSQETDCMLILIAPNWPRQQWFTQLLELSIDHPLRLPSSQKLLRQPQTHTFHKTPEIFKFHAWKLSSSKEKREAFRQKYLNGSPAHRKIPLSRCTKASGEGFVIGVSDGMKIHSTPMW